MRNGLCKWVTDVPYTRQRCGLYRPWHCVLTACSAPLKHRWTLICRAVDCERTSNRSRLDLYCYHHRAVVWLCHITYTNNLPVMLILVLVLVCPVLVNITAIFTSWTAQTQCDVTSVLLTSAQHSEMQVLVEMEVIAAGLLGIALWAGTTWVAVGESWFLGRDERAAVTR